MSKKMCVVVGSGRCGSSVVTACISFCGLSLGPSLATKTDDHNKKGYFENSAILRFNQRALDMMGDEYFGFKPISTHIREQYSHSLVEDLVKILDAEFTEDLCLIKDPRILKLWHEYKQAFAHCGFDPYIVALYRPIEKSVRSYFKMFPNKKPDDIRNAMEYYVDLLEHHKVEFPHIDINFDSFVHTPDQDVKKIMDIMGIDMQVPVKRIQEFVDFGLISER